MADIVIIDYGMGNVHSVAKALDLKFRRIQFTPDLMPSDITGTEIIVDGGLTAKP